MFFWNLAPAMSPQLHLDGVWPCCCIGTCIRSVCLLKHGPCWNGICIDSPSKTQATGKRCETVYQTEHVGNKRHVLVR